MYYQDKSDSNSKPEQQERFNDHIKYEPTTKQFKKFNTAANKFFSFSLDSLRLTKSVNYNIYRCGGFTSYTMPFRFVFSVPNS